MLYICESLVLKIAQFDIIIGSNRYLDSFILEKFAHVENITLFQCASLYLSK